MAKKVVKKKELLESGYNLKTLKVKTNKSKIHIKINSKIKKLHKEKEALELLKAKIIDINKEYNERIMPLQDKVFKVDEELLLLFEKFKNKKTVGKYYKEMALDQIKSIIAHFARAGYMSAAVSRIEKEIRQTDFNFSKEEEEEARETFDAMLEEMFEETGEVPDISFDDFKNMSMEEIMAKMQQKVFESDKEAEEQEKKEYKQEQQSYNDDTFKKMYKTLAKILHPDKVNDNDPIDNKEQLMIDLSLAWEERDYLKLLEINTLVNPNADEIELDKKHLKEIERSITEELASIKDFKYAVKNNATEQFYRYNEFYHVLKSKREAGFKSLETEMKESIIDKEKFNKDCFKSIKKTREYLDETVFDGFGDEDLLSLLEDEFLEDLF